VSGKRDKATECGELAYSTETTEYNVKSARSPVSTRLAGGPRGSSWSYRSRAHKLETLRVSAFAQLQRASLSVQLNIAEGYAFGDSPSFTRHLAIAYGSAVETGELLEVALEAHVIVGNWAAISLTGIAGASGCC
jgi:four helix bundle protein